MKHFKKILYLIMPLVVASVSAQKGLTDTVYQLTEVQVGAFRLENFTTGNKLIKLDSSVMNDFNAQALAELLAMNSQLSINSYGQGGLSNATVRGAGSEHTAVLWNGFNLQSPTDGGVNMALLPVNFIDEVTLQYGGSSALFGSGAVGGVIHINNVPEFNKGLDIELNGNYGSFNTHGEGLNLRISKKIWISSLRTFYYAAENDFPFENTAQFGSPEVRMDNSAIRQYGIMQENYVKLAKNQQLSTRLWYQDNYGQVPPPMTKFSSLAYQDDEIIRGTIEWKYSKEKVNVFARSAFFDNKINYNDSAIGLESFIHSQTYINELESRIRTGKKSELNIGLNDTYDRAITYNYAQDQTRNRLAIFGSFKLHNISKSHQIVLSLREELIDHELSVPTSSLGYSCLIYKNIKLLGNVSRNYKVPTFNQLYWKIWGNPNLKPESGWSEEAGLNVSKKLGDVTVEYKFTAFNANVKDWIIWLPHGTIWSPENVKKVWSRGLESDLNLSYSFNKFQLSLSCMYSYIRSTNSESEANTEETEGMQLIYVPMNKGNARLTIDYKSNYLNYTQLFNGKRFTTADNSRWIDPYSLANIVIGRKLSLKKMKAGFNFRINNIWNTSYQVMSWYAMPGRNYQVGISIMFNNPNH